MTPEERRAYNKKYRETHREEFAKYQAKYCKTHKQVIVKYRETHKQEITKQRAEYHKIHKEKITKYNKEYNKTHKEEISKHNTEYYKTHKQEIVKYQSEFRKTPSGKLIIKKHISKRRRELDWVPLNDWFDGAHGHHINNTHVIYIPISLHRKYQGHRLNKPQTMIQINIEAFKFMNPDVYTHLVEAYTMKF